LQLTFDVDGPAQLAGQDILLEGGIESVKGFSNLSMMPETRSFSSLISSLFLTQSICKYWLFTKPKMTCWMPSYSRQSPLLR